VDNFLREKNMAKMETRISVHLTHDQMELVRDALAIVQEEPYRLTEDEDLMAHFEQLAFETGNDVSIAQVMEHDPIQVENLNYESKH
jgi:hypothetical protein